MRIFKDKIEDLKIYLGFDIFLFLFWTSFSTTFKGTSQNIVQLDWKMVRRSKKVDCEMLSMTSPLLGLIKLDFDRYALGKLSQLEVEGVFKDHHGTMLTAFFR